MLPIYTRSGPSRKSFHSREKCLIVLVLVTLCLLCFGGIFLLPDNFGGERVLKAYQRLQKAGPEIFIPAPPIAPHGLNSNEEIPRVIDDRAKLQAKIREELDDILDKPETAPVNIVNNNNNEIQPPIAGPPVKSTDSDNEEVEIILKYIPNGQDPNPDVQEKRNKIKEVSSC